VTPLLALRHAATDGNEAGLFQGRADRSLSPAGRSAAASWRLPAFAQAWPAVASPLRRARETAAAMGLAAAVEPALIEMDWGAWEGRARAALAEDPAFLAAERLGLDLLPPGGESPRQVAARLEPWLAGLEQDLVAVTHKGVLRALLHLATGWDFQGKPPAKARAGIALLFAREAGRWRLEAGTVPLA